MNNVEPIPGLDGEKRQHVAAGLWRAWREDGRGAAVLTGFSGLGKTQQVVRPLVARATSEGIPAVHIDVQLHPTSLDQELTALLMRELRDDGREELAKATGNQPTFLQRSGTFSAMVRLSCWTSSSGCWSRRVRSRCLASALRKIAQRAPDEGGFWLVSNRFVDPGWTEPFYPAELEPPTCLDLQRIVLQGISMASAEERFPADRRMEVVWRLGANPLALRLLGHLLRLHALGS
jgi:hypothetical protein